MNKTEIAKLLAMAATVDSRNVGTEHVEGWHRVLGEVEFEPAVDAMWAHFRDSTDWLLPAHIKQRVSDSQKAKPASDASYYCKDHWLPKVDGPKCERCLEADNEKENN